MISNIDTIREPLKKFNHIIDLLLIASKRQYYIEKNEYNRRYNHAGNNGYVMNVLLESYHYQFSEIEILIKKIDHLEAQCSDIWNDLSFFYNKEYIDGLKENKMIKNYDLFW